MVSGAAPLLCWQMINKLLFFFKIDSPPAFCIFEYVYFARPDSMFEGQIVYSVRQNCGRQLAIEAPVNPPNGDTSNLIVSAVPESAIPAALGYALESGIPYVEVLCRNRYVGKCLLGGD